MVATKKFSELTDVGNAQVNDSLPALRDGDNVRVDIPGTGFYDANGNWLIRWSTAGASAVNFLEVQNALSGSAPAGS